MDAKISDLVTFNEDNADQYLTTDQGLRINPKHIEIMRMCGFTECASLQI